MAVQITSPLETNIQQLGDFQLFHKWRLP